MTDSDRYLRELRDGLARHDDTTSAESRLCGSRRCHRRYEQLP